ncbi:MAG: YceI family protein [Chitinophagaceae bacterium]|nr:YceI family protein [Chitinophagaceae bacterium]
MNATKYSIKQLLCLLFLMTTMVSVQAQKFYTKSGRIDFFSRAPLENIQAVNKTVVAILDSKTGKVEFNVFIRGFEFEKALMQEHFNENYMETSKYPKATFSGEIQHTNVVNYALTGEYKVIVKGMLAMHGISKAMEVSGVISVIDGFPTLKAAFTISLADYKIHIPAIVRDKISPNVTITVNSLLNNTLK